jgi:hypothetical protein
MYELRVVRVVFQGKDPQGVGQGHFFSSREGAR